MAKQSLDTTCNEYVGTTLAKINENFTDLYNGTGATSQTLTTLTTSDLATIESLKVDTGTKTATATAGAATLSKTAGVVTSEAITTAAGATYTLTLTNTKVAATSQVFASVNLGAGTGGTPAITSVTPGSGSVVIVVQNIHASAAFNAAIKIAFLVLDN